MFSRPFHGSHLRRTVLAMVGALCSSSVGCEADWVTLGRMQSPAGTTGGVSQGSTTVATGGTDARETVGGASSTATTATGGITVTASTAGGATGVGGFSEPKFTDVIRVPSLASDYADDNPTLTDNMLELYFSSKNRPGGKGNVDVWVAKRPTLSADFGEPTLVAAVSTEGVESSPAISGDGLTLWVASQPAADAMGGHDILQSTRTSIQEEFGTPVLVRELSSAQDDIPRPTGAGGLLMPLASRRDNAMYWTYLARRPSLHEPFETPQLIQELIVEGQNVADAFLSADGRTIFFSHAQDQISDLFVAHRPVLEEPFGEAIRLSTINSPDDDRDPWLSPDGTILYFSSDRHQAGTLNIYQARLVE
ncbi:MAG TPA: hypothetical protein VKP30_07620 [Polyangiaceae bacterium]|nr:hypothetical protein [Polyangiaceae bacterium]